MADSHLAILHVVAPAPFGGLESVVRMLAEGHHRRGHRVHVAVVLPPGSSAEAHPFVRSLAAGGVSVLPCLVGDRNYLGERAAIAKVVRARGIQVVHTHGFRPDVVDGGIARRLAQRTVSTVHSFAARSTRGRVYEWIQRRALREFDAVAAVSRTIAHQLRASGLDDQKVHLVPNAFMARTDTLGRAAARNRLAIHTSERVVGWVGRLSSEKGPDLALRAFAQVGRPDIVLAMLGAGREEVNLRSLAGELGVADRVRWLGAVEDAATLFPAFDAYLISSRSEGTPIALLEAMAAGVPLIVARVGGIPDVVGLDAAWVVEPGDVDALAAAINERFALPALAESRAAVAATRLREQFTLDPWLDRYEALYRAPHPVP